MWSTFLVALAAFSAILLAVMTLMWWMIKEPGA